MRKKISLCLNVLIILLEVIGLILSIDSLKDQMFLYYTQDSNIFLLFASILYLFFYDKKDNRFVSLCKYGATVSVLITFLVVILVLAPTTNLSYDWLLFSGANLYYHTLCPLLGLVTFLFFDNVHIKGFKDNMWALLFTFIYTVIFLALNILRVVEGPYPFLKVYENPLIVSIVWFILIEGGAFIFTKLLEIGKNKIQTE